jgi:hypothetical protein
MIGGQGNSDPFTQILSMFNSMQQMSQMFGIPMGGMMPQGQPGNQPNQPVVEPAPIERHNINELQEEN